MCLVEIAATKDCVLVFCIKCLQCAQISPKLSQRHRERKKREVGEEANKQRQRMNAELSMKKYPYTKHLTASDILLQQSFTSNRKIILIMELEQLECEEISVY